MAQAGTVVSIVLCLVSTSALPAGPRVPPDMVILAAQPSVYTVLVRGDFELTLPANVSLAGPVLELDLAADKEAGRAPKELGELELRWAKLAENPGRYLIIDEGTRTEPCTDRVFSYGTAFAVSREGILLSAAHVFQDPARQACDGIRLDTQLLDQHVFPVADMLVRELGGVPGERIGPQVLDALLNWCSQHMTVTGKFRSAQLVLKFDQPSSVLGKNWFAAPQPITVPLEVVAMGEPAPGKDVAVLRAVMDPGQREKLKAAGARDDEISGIMEATQCDKLICLPLGDSTDLLPGANVQAMGFPDTAFVGEWMKPAAAYRVSARGGQIGQTKPVRGGYDMIEMTAGIDHGDSGGPVLDADGRVIGINVGGGGNNAATLAVPINVAKEFLAKGGITPDTGKLTKRWEEAIRAFAAGDFTAAQDLLTLIERNQGGDMVLMALQNPLDPQPVKPALGRNENLLVTPNFVNPYVLELKHRIAAGKR